MRYTMRKKTSHIITTLVIVLTVMTTGVSAFINHQQTPTYHPIIHTNYSDGIDDIGWYTSIAVDDTNLPHISYYHYTRGNLKYASYNGVEWSTEVIDKEGDVGRYTSLVFDSEGNPHISYYDKTNGDLKYAYHNGSDWVTTCVDSNGNAGLFTAITTDSNNNPHISYVEYGTHELRYAYRDENTWVIDHVDDDVGCGEYFSDTTSIQLDSEDYPHISYLSRPNFDLKYAYYNGTNWIKTIIDTSNNIGQYSSLQLDTCGQPHISYGDWTNFDLKYAYYNQSGWTIETVDAPGDVRKWTSLVLINDFPSIVYYDYFDGDLKKASFDGGNWQRTILDAEGAVGCFNSAIVDTLKNLHISYYSWSNKSLKYAQVHDDIVTIHTIENPVTEDQLDQQQYNCCGYSYGIFDTMPIAQGFIPTNSLLTRVELMLLRHDVPGPLTVSIRENLDGKDLTNCTLTSEQIAEDMSWKLFDFSDITVEPGTTYYIVCTSSDTHDNSMYWWYFDINNPYTLADAWIKSGNWKKLTDSSFPGIDLGFKTYGRASYAPSKPDITGPTNPKVREECEYQLKSYDEDNHSLYYTIKYGDGYNETIGPYISGEEITITHSWEKRGTYLLQVQAVDSTKAESDWGTLEITVPKNIPDFIHRDTPYNRYITHLISMIHQLINLSRFS